MRYADDCRIASLQRLLPLREREPYRAALDLRFASETQPDPNPMLPYARVRAANFDRRPSARGRKRPRQEGSGLLIGRAVVDRLLECLRADQQSVRPALRRLGDCGRLKPWPL